MAPARTVGFMSRNGKTLAERVNALGAERDKIVHTSN
jgi:hypothetical protein